MKQTGLSFDDSNVSAARTLTRKVHSRVSAYGLAIRRFANGDSREARSACYRRRQRHSNDGGSVRATGTTPLLWTLVLSRSEWRSLGRVANDGTVEACLGQMRASSRPDGPRRRWRKREVFAKRRRRPSLDSSPTRRNFPAATSFHPRYTIRVHPRGFFHMAAARSHQAKLTTMSAD